MNDLLEIKEWRKKMVKIFTPNKNGKIEFTKADTHHGEPPTVTLNTVEG